MLLSACILTKDEPHDLRRALASLGGVADEIVIIANHDSSQETEAVAREFDAKLVPHHWQRDFAAARNVGLEAARGDWVYWIDTDEELLTADRTLFEKILSDDKVLGYYVRIQDVLADSPASMSERHHRSLYRRRNDIRYIGRVHEHFEPSLEERAERSGMQVKLSPVKVRHRGYVAERTPRRLRRNVELMELELGDRPGQLYYQIEMGRSLLLLGDERGHSVLAEAARQVLATARERRASIPLVATLLEYALARDGADCPLTADQAEELAMRWFPNSPPLLWRAARWHYSQGRFAKAASLLEKLLELGRRHSFDDEISFDQQIFGDETVLNLGVCWARVGKLDKARKFFKSLSQRHGPFADAAASNLRQLKGQ